MNFAHYLRKFESNSEFNAAYNGDDYDEPWVSATLIPSGETESPEYYRVDYNKSDNRKYLTFVIETDGVIRWKAGSSVAKTIEYKKNKGEWTSITAGTGNSAPSISVSSGDVVKFRGDNESYSVPTEYDCCSFSGTTCSFKLEGNIMSLIDSDDFPTLENFTSGWVFNCLFRHCSTLTSAKDLVLPATAMTNQSYRMMFSGCTSLTDAPKVLPATTLAQSCYEQMFVGCSSLTGIPALAEATLTPGCYYGLFKNCTSLTTTPNLPATTLADGCYMQMFQGCSSLTTAPELPAPTLPHNAYYEMFTGCTRLNYVKCLAVSGINVDGSTDRWLGFTSSTGTFVKSPDVSESTWGRSYNGIPENWTVQNA